MDPLFNPIAWTVVGAVFGLGMGSILVGIIIAYSLRKRLTERQWFIVQIIGMPVIVFCMLGVCWAIIGVFEIF